MNFGQMLAALLNGTTTTRDGLERHCILEAVQKPTGMITEPYIVQRFPNGSCSVYTPTQADIFANNWRNAAGEGNMSREGTEVHEREPAGGRRL